MSRPDRRPHGLDAAGAGDAGAVDSGDVFGPCPSCDAELRVGHVLNPRSGRVERAIMHPIPFCTYYGETDPNVIEREVMRAQELL